MKKQEPETKTVRFRLRYWKRLKRRTDKLSKERGSDTIGMPAYLLETSEFFEDNRKLNKISKEDDE
jgi:hypothetical protein